MSDQAVTSAGDDDSVTTRDTEIVTRGSGVTTTHLHILFTRDSLSNVF